MFKDLRIQHVHLKYATTFLVFFAMLFFLIAWFTQRSYNFTLLEPFIGLLFLFIFPLIFYVIYSLFESAENPIWKSILGMVLFIFLVIAGMLSLVATMMMFGTNMSGW